MTTGDLLAMVNAVSLPWEIYVQLMFILYELSDLQRELGILKASFRRERYRWN